VERSSGAAPPRQPGGSGQSEDAGALLDIRIEAAEGSASLVSLAGELDLSTIPKLEARLFEELSSRPGVIVDLTRLTFIDSSGIGLLIKAFRAADGSRMHTVVAPGSQVARVFEIAGIGRAMSVFGQRDQALAALNGTGR
jgi:anti-sigma B factor antagonist